MIELVFLLSVLTLLSYLCTMAWRVFVRGMSKRQAFILTTTGALNKILVVALILAVMALLISQVDWPSHNAISNPRYNI